MVDGHLFLNEEMRNSINQQSHQTTYQSSVDPDKLQVFSYFQFQFFTQLFSCQFPTVVLMRFPN